jgi:hypothetical protein
MDDNNENHQNIPSGNETIKIFLRIRPTVKRHDHVSKKIIK